MMNKKILFIARNIPVPGQPNPNGIILKIAKNLKSASMTIDVLFPKEFVPFFLKKTSKYSYISQLPNQFTLLDFAIATISYFRIPTAILSFLLIHLSCILNKKKLAKYKEYDLTHAHYILPDAYFSYWLKKKYQIPYVISVRGSDCSFIQRLPKWWYVHKLIRKILSNADSVLCHNNGQQQLIGQLGIQTQLIKHGIDPIFFEKKEKTSTNSIVHLLSVGALIPIKQIDWVIKAVKSYKGSKKVQLTIVGDGPEYENLERLSASSPHSIQFAGRKNKYELSELYQQTDVFALPGRQETFGLVFAEAMAGGCAVIGYKGQGIYGHFQEDRDILFASSYNDFETKIHRLIDDHQYRTFIAQQGQEQSKSFKWEEVTRSYKTIYQSIY